MVKMGKLAHPFFLNQCSRLKFILNFNQKWVAIFHASLEKKLAEMVLLVIIKAVPRANATGQQSTHVCPIASWMMNTPPNHFVRKAMGKVEI